MLLEAKDKNRFWETWLCKWHLSTAPPWADPSSVPGLGRVLGTWVLKECLLFSVELSLAIKEASKRSC